MRIALVALLAAACGSPAKPSPPLATSPPVAKPYPAPLYAKLFERGATFVYSYETESSRWDDDVGHNVDSKGSGSMTCTVAEVEELPSALAAHVECDAQLGVGGAGPDGIYVATAAGLWRADGTPKTAPSDPKTMMMAAIPGARENLKPPRPGREEVIDGTRIYDAGGGSWCWSETFSEGDDGSTQICFANGAIVHGAASFAGGSSHEATYHLATR